eukprot:scaffold2725_cov137-Skeletonema_menzelii.AAC.3
MSLRSLIPPRGNQHALKESENRGCGSQSINDEFDLVVEWDAVIERARSHPHEASECYLNNYMPTDSTESGSHRSDSPINYKPLHAACKHNPPLGAVEALVSAHPTAVLERTVEGTALKIAAVSRVSSIQVLRFLLVAELAMWKRLVQDTGGNEEDSSGEGMQASLYHGKNPIHWIYESSISVHAAGMLLTVYPEGAFKRSLQSLTETKAESPLIEIINDFADDQERLENVGNIVNESVEDVCDENEKDSESTEDKRSGKERRWQKFLLILQATDRVLNLSEPLPFTGAGPRITPNPSLTNQAASRSANISTTATNSKPPLKQRKSDFSTQRFNPVHTFIRCIMNHKLGLERCRDFCVWCVLDEMGKRIPQEEFVGSFQILAESQRADCRLCHSEIEDFIEFLINADRETAFTRMSDGRLVGNVAIENGWPCKEALLRQIDAFTCFTRLRREHTK